jgi:hypothetical protein
VVQKDGAVPAAKVLTPPAVEAKKAAVPQAKLSAAPNLTPPAVVKDKKTNVPAAKVYTEPIKAEKPRNLRV